jgi:hypothetical protein
MQALRVRGGTTPTHRKFLIFKQQTVHIIKPKYHNNANTPFKKLYNMQGEDCA